LTAFSKNPQHQISQKSNQQKVSCSM